VKKICTAALLILLVMPLGSCKCAAQKQALTEFRNSHKLLTTKLMKYVNADQGITGNPADSEEKKAAARADWQKQVDKDLENIDRLEKGSEN